jgi:hypothetical protein
LTRYLRKCQTAALAGLASLVVVAVAAAPAGAGTSTNQACTTPAPYKPQTCQTLKTTVKPQANLKAKVSVTVNDTPTVTVKLYRKKADGTYKFLRNVFRGNVASGTKKLSIKSKKPGKYELKTKANGHGLVAVTVNKFRLHH